MADRRLGGRGRRGQGHVHGALGRGSEVPGSQILGSDRRRTQQERDTVDRLGSPSEANSVVGLRFRWGLRPRTMDPHGQFLDRQGERGHRRRSHDVVNSGHRADQQALAQVAIDRPHVGTELLPDIEEVVMVRQPPSPDSDRPKPPSERKPTAGASAPKSDRP